MDYPAAMVDSKIIEDLAREISAGIPAGVKLMQADLEKNLHTLLQGALAKLDLVTREEFDVQTRVLARSREKLERLEQAVAGLENRSTE
jgi:hypothetical protein